MRSPWLNKFIIRFSVIFFIHLIFVAGDATMDIWDFSTRRLVFSMFFITYWLVIWYVAGYINLIIHNKQAISPKYKAGYNWLLFLFNFGYGLSAAFITNLVYRFGDLYLFKSYDAWEDVPIGNPELTMSLFSLYMIIFTADIFFSSAMKRKEDQIKMEELKRENTLAQYLVLKSQLEPHFLFNSLSVLSSIIHTDINLAEEFIIRLSKTLRYVIEKNELTLVPLADEISFVDDYFFLIRNRFEKSIIFENSIEASIIQNSYIPPASLQLLIENAVKHNKFSSDDPLQIQLLNDKDSLIVKNNKDMRNDVSESTNRGLINLKQRFSYFSDRRVNIVDEGSEFTVWLPILTKSDYERFNI
ncbi:MAG: histidine kinase [Bacteroidales bacterium]